MFCAKFSEHVSFKIAEGIGWGTGLKKVLKKTKFSWSLQKKLIFWLILMMLSCMRLCISCPKHLMLIKKWKEGCNGTQVQLERSVWCQILLYGIGGNLGSEPQLLVVRQLGAQRPCVIFFVLDRSFGVNSNLGQLNEKGIVFSQTGGRLLIDVSFGEKKVRFWRLKICLWGFVLLGYQHFRFVVWLHNWVYF